MIKRYRKYSLLFILCFIAGTKSLMSQKDAMAPKDFTFHWQKANGDQYEIPVENKLKIQIEQQKINRALMQILLKSLLKSKTFESFNPHNISLFPDEKNQVAKLDFTILDPSNKEQKYTYYFSFDSYGNVFDSIDN